MLALQHVHRRYGNVHALNDLTMEVRTGEVVGFLGPNGAGKTTAMRAIMGIVQPDSGQVLWNAAPIILATRQRFGYMPEERGLYPAMGVIAQIVYFAQLHGMTTQDATRRAHSWLDVLGLHVTKKTTLHALSLGNQQRVQLIASLIHEPDFLVLDEPFSGLDPTGIETLSDILRERARNGVAVLFSSHQLDLVESVCDRVCIVHEGRIVTTGTVDELTRATHLLSVRLLERSDADWAHDLTHVEVLGVDHGEVRLQLREGASANDVLSRAQQVGTVVHFGFATKRLSEVFREVTAS